MSMKKWPVLLILFVVQSIFFSSCTQTTGISLYKRHYRDGYNLQVSGKLSNPKTQKTVTPENIILENVSIEHPEYASLQSSGENYIKQAPLSFINNELKNKENGNAGKDEIVINNKRKIPAYKKTSMAVSQIVSPIKTITEKTFELKHLISENKKSIIRDEDPHIGGGLIWTIIVILLVLWILSLLTGGWGLGGLLYLFLVVALILILLRLLRYI